MFLLLMVMISSLPSPPSSRLQDLAGALRACHSATVRHIRIAGPLVVGRGSRARFTQATTIIASRPVGPAWISRAADVLAENRKSYLMGEECPSNCWPCDSVAHLEAEIEMGSAHAPTTIVLLLAPRCADVFTRDAPVGEVTGSAVRRLLDLMKEALPEDSLLQATRFAQTETGPAVDPSRPEYGDHVGDYVYVELLPEAVRKIEPVYPADARRRGIEGTVIVQALVSKNGRVTEARIDRSIPSLDAAALNCVRGWYFKPALSNHQPVATWVAVPVRFSLH